MAEMEEQIQIMQEYKDRANEGISAEVKKNNKENIRLFLDAM